MRHPNLLLVILDSVRADHLSCYGYEYPTTPFLDRLAQDSLLFESAFTSGPWSLPSHASLFTGLYTSQHGADLNYPYLSPQFQTIAEMLSAQGYETVGLSPNPWVGRETGLSRGFEKIRELWFTAQVGFLKRALGRVGLMRWKPSRHLLRQLRRKVERSRPDKGAQRIHREVERWLRERSPERPFFLFINYFDAHLPYGAPEPFRYRFLPPDASPEDCTGLDQFPLHYLIDRSSLGEEDFALLRGLYDGGVAYLDACLEKLCALLQAAGAFQDTLLVITADHGENLGDHGLMSHDYCVYDTLIQVPLLVRHPRYFPRGERWTALAELIDLWPTLVDLLGMDPAPLNPARRGRSWLAGETGVDRDFIVAEYLEPNLARFGPYRESRDLREFARTMRCVRTKEYKYIRYEDGTEEFHDLNVDPQERYDLSTAGMEPHRRLKEALEQWVTSIGPSDRTRETKELSPQLQEHLRDLGYL